MIEERDATAIQSRDNWNPYVIRSVQLLEDKKVDYGNLHSKGKVAPIKRFYLEEIQCETENKCFYNDATQLVILSSYCLTEISPKFFTYREQRKNKNKQFHDVNDFVHEIMFNLGTDLDA